MSISHTKQKTAHKGKLNLRSPIHSIRKEERVIGFLFVLPVALVILLLVYYPLAQGFHMSLQSLNYSLGNQGTFIGFRNYLNVIKDPDNLAAIQHTIEYLGISILFELVGGLIFALTLNNQFSGRGVILAIVILPWALPGVVSGVLWSRIFNPDNGILNNILFRMGFIQTYQLWFSKPFLSILFISIVHVWSYLPLTTLLILSGLQTIPDDLYDSSAIDGASPFDQFRLITLPLLRPTIAIALTIISVNALGIFDQIYILNGLALSTRSITQQIYNLTFRQLNFGQGTALGFWLTLFTLVVSFGYIKNLRSLR